MFSVTKTKVSEGHSETNSEQQKTKHLNLISKLVNSKIVINKTATKTTPAFLNLYSFSFPLI